MAIPESQLETWSHQGSIAQSSTTYNAVRGALEISTSPYSAKDCVIFLQGSYGNDTNIHTESDVDVVIKLNECWHSDLNELSDEEKSAYKSAFIDATYGHPEFKRDVLSVLVTKYETDVKYGGKAISIAANGSRRKVDVIPAIEFRRYHKFNGKFDQVYDEGICFYTSGGERVANYPRQHSANLTRKHQSTGNRLKPMIRIMKNFRTRLVDDGRIPVGSAPSYYLEGLLYNVPNELFVSGYQDCFVSIFNWIQNSDRSKFVCANEQYYLLWENTHTSWQKENCEQFLAAVRVAWQEW